MKTATQFTWQCHPKAEALVIQFLEEFVNANSFIQKLQEHLLRQTSTRLFDWVDHIVVRYSDSLEKQIKEDGFLPQHTTSAYRLYHHAEAQLPRVVMTDQAERGIGVAICVDNIADFLMAQGKRGWIEGSALSAFRRCCVCTENEVSLWVVERRGTESIEPIYMKTGYLNDYLEAVEKWQTRPRLLWEDEKKAINCALILVDDIVQMLGEDLAACVVLEVERKYWQSRNLAGQLQKNRQDRLGLGWANHDHHTFRSSREHFTQLVRLFEMLGFHCRERFYAGQEAGWGAQVMENPRAKLVLFLDVDLAPHELEQDFAHHPLPPLSQLGTIGLWCALHGDSILSGGMHHLEAQFMFEELTQDLKGLHVRMMDPFSNFPFLKQAFTEGEVWQVDPKRLHELVESGKISSEEEKRFLTQGALGSHLENLQRREGYKGFNQKNVSSIIKRTDPRT